MIKTLVSIDADLASSIALRFTCQLANKTEVDIQTLHVQEPQTLGPAVGAGWARRTWEKELVQEGKKEIAQLLVAESGFCPVLKEPIVLSGDRDKEILKELETGHYHLFVEGSPATHTPKGLARRVESRLYQHAPCPVLVIPNLLPLNQVLAVIRDEPGCHCVFSSLRTLFQRLDLELDILLSSLRPSDAAEISEEAVRTLASDYGWTIRNSQNFLGSVESFAHQLGGYGLIVVAMQRPMKGKNPLVEFLGRLSSPILFCWR
jgi:hypothetical protein